MSIDYPPGTDWEAPVAFPADAPAEAMHQTEDDFCLWPLASGRLDEVLRKVAHAGVDPNEIYVRVDGGVWRYLRTIRLAEP